MMNWSLKTRIRCVITLAFFIALVLSLLDFPTNRNKTVQVMNENGDAVLLTVNVIIHRYILLPDKISGYILINGEKYISVEDTSGIHYDLEFKDIFHEPKSRSFLFLLDSNEFVEAHSRQVLLSTEKYDFNDVQILFFSREGSFMYKTAGFVD